MSAEVKRTFREATSGPAPKLGAAAAVPEPPAAAEAQARAKLEAQVRELQEANAQLRLRAAARSSALPAPLASEVEAVLADLRATIAAQRTCVEELQATVASRNASLRRLHEAILGRPSPEAEDGTDEATVVADFTIALHRRDERLWELQAVADEANRRAAVLADALRERDQHVQALEDAVDTADARVQELEQRFQQSEVPPYIGAPALPIQQRAAAAQPVAASAPGSMVEGPQSLSEFINSLNSTNGQSQTSSLPPAIEGGGTSDPADFLHDAEPAASLPLRDARSPSPARGGAQLREASPSLSRAALSAFQGGVDRQVSGARLLSPGNRTGPSSGQHGCSFVVPTAVYGSPGSSFTAASMNGCTSPSAARLLDAGQLSAQVGPPVVRYSSPTTSATVTPRVLRATSPSPSRTVSGLWQRTASPSQQQQQGSVAWKQGAAAPPSACIVAPAGPVQPVNVAATRCIVMAGTGGGSPPRQASPRQASPGPVVSTRLRGQLSPSPCGSSRPPQQVLAVQLSPSPSGGLPPPGGSFARLSPAAPALPQTDPPSPQVATAPPTPPQSSRSLTATSPDAWKHWEEEHFGESTPERLVSGVRRATSGSLTRPGPARRPPGTR